MVTDEDSEIRNGFIAIKSYNLCVRDNISHITDMNDYFWKFSSSSRSDRVHASILLLYIPIFISMLNILVSHISISLFIILFNRFEEECQFSISEDFILYFSCSPFECPSDIIQCSTWQIARKVVVFCWIFRMMCVYTYFLSEGECKFSISEIFIFYFQTLIVCVQ